MSLTLTKHPVTIESGKTLNMFPGFKPIEIVFSRQDIALVSIGSGAGTKVQIVVTGDITSALSVGDFIYISSEGANFIYDTTAEVTAISFGGGNTTILTDVDFIETTTGDGYINYLQNYRVEVKLVRVDNEDIDLLGFSLFDDGTPAGVITIDTSIINYLNTLDILTATALIEASRIKYNIKYREVFDNSAESFTTIDNPIIADYATIDFNIDEFITPFLQPKIWKGYDTGEGFQHSDANNAGEKIQILKDELDINQGDISADANVKIFDLNDYGLMFVNGINSGLNANTKFLKLKINTILAGEYNAAEYNNAEYNT